jgi:hypothetical protein
MPLAQPEVSGSCRNVAQVIVTKFFFGIRNGFVNRTLCPTGTGRVLIVGQRVVLSVAPIGVIEVAISSHGANCAIAE